MEKLHTPEADISTASLLSNLYNNLSNTYLYLGKNEKATRALRTAFDIRLEYESAECLDYGLCQTMYGILSLGERKPVEAEKHLLQAEQIISTVIGKDNNYMKTIYRYLYSLYTRWNKPELAEKYKQKLLPGKRS